MKQRTGRANARLTRQRHRIPKPDRRRALALLASCRDGCPESLMVPHGFPVTLLAALVRDGLAAELAGASSQAGAR